MTSSAPKQHGFAAIAAIFLIVVLAALGGFMLTFSNTQQLGSAQDILGSRAYWAARGGLEWVIGSVAASGACPVSPPSLSIDVFTVTVTCLPTAYSEAGATVTIFQFISTAKTAGAVGSATYVERSISASMEK